MTEYRQDSITSLTEGKVCGIIICMFFQDIKMTSYTLIRIKTERQRWRNVRPMLKNLEAIFQSEHCKHFL